MPRTACDESLNRQRSVKHRLGDRYPRERPKEVGERRVVRWAAGAEQQFEIDDAAGRDLTSEQQRFDDTANLGTSVRTRQRAPIGTDRSDSLSPRSAT